MKSNLIAAVAASARAATSREHAAAQHEIVIAVGILVARCHGAAKAAGWWGNEARGKPDPRDNPMCFSNKLMLTVSELAEAMEGDRKNLADDKLPQYPMRAVELADAAIRLFDMAGAFGIPLGEIIAAKMEYNATRPDHKSEAREAAGGKSY